MPPPLEGQFTSRGGENSMSKGAKIMNKVMLIVRRVWHEQEGATAVEYGLMVALIAAVIIVAVTSLGTNVKAAFCTVINALSAAGIAGTVTAGC